MREPTEDAIRADYARYQRLEPTTRQPCNWADVAHWCIGTMCIVVMAILVVAIAVWAGAIK